MDNIGRAFSFMFEDKDWPSKILIGGLFVLVSFVLVGIPFVLGYILEAVKRSSQNKAVPLPQWDNLGDKFMHGLVYLIILIIYSLPGWILYLVPCIGHFCLGPLWWIALLFVLPYITVRYSLTGNLADAFQFKEIVEFAQSNLSDLFIVMLLSIALAVISSFGLLLLIVGALFTWFWAELALSYLYGQLYCSASKKAELKSEASQA